MTIADSFYYKSLYIVSEKGKAKALTYFSNKLVLLTARFQVNYKILWLLTNLEGHTLCIGECILTVLPYKNWYPDRRNTDFLE